MFAIIEGGVSVLKKKWKRKRHERRRPHFTFTPSPPHASSPSPLPFTLFSFLTKFHLISLDNALCVDSREPVFEGRFDSSAVVGTSSSGRWIAWVNVAEERVYIGDLQRQVVVDRLPVPLRVQDEANSNLRETTYVSNVDKIHISDDAQTVVAIYHFKEKTSADCFVDLHKQLDVVITAVEIDESPLQKITLDIRDCRYRVHSSGIKPAARESVLLRCKEIAHASDRPEAQVVAFMKNNVEQRALGVNSARERLILFYCRSTEHIFEYDLTSGIGVSKDVTIQSMAWTCDGLFLCVALSDATLVVLTNCGEPVQLYVQGNFGPALERKRIEEFKLDCPRMYKIPKNKLLKPNMLRGHWTAVTHPTLPLFLITNGCVLMMVKLPTFRLYAAPTKPSTLASSYNAAIEALTYGVRSEDALTVACDGLELIEKEDFIRHAFHAWTLLLNYPYRWSSIFHESCRLLFRYLSKKALNSARDTLDVLRIASQVLFVYERDKRLGNLLLNEVALLLRLLVSGLIKAKRFHEAAYVLRLFEESALGIRFDRQWVALATEARKQTCRDLEHDPVLSEQAREVIADPLSAIAYERLRSWSLLQESNSVEIDTSNVVDSDVNSDAVVSYLLYLRLPEEELSAKTEALATAGAYPYMCHLLRCLDFERALEAATMWLESGEPTKDVVRAISLLVNTIFDFFVGASDGIFVPHPIYCYHSSTKSRMKLSRNEIQNATLEVEDWSLERAVHFATVVLDSSQLHVLLRKVGDVQAVLSLLPKALPVLEEEQVFDLLQRQFCVSLLREDLSALRSLQSLLEKHEFGLKVDFGLVWFFLNFLKRNKTTYNPLEMKDKGDPACIGALLVSTLLDLLQRRERHGVERRKIFTAHKDINCWRESPLKGHLKEVVRAVIEWVPILASSTPGKNQFKENVDRSLLLLKEDTAISMSRVTLEIRRMDTENLERILDLVFEAEDPYAKTTPLDSTLTGYEVKNEGTVDVSSRPVCVEDKSAGIEVKTPEVLQPLPEKILQNVKLHPEPAQSDTESESLPAWHIHPSDYEGERNEPTSNALELLLQAQRDILRRLDQLNLDKPEPKRDVATEVTEAVESELVSDVSVLEDDDDSEPYSAAARIFNRKVMQSLRWRTLPSQQPTPIYSQREEEQQHRKPGIPLHDLMNTQTKIRRLYNVTEREINVDVASIRKPRQQYVEECDSEVTKVHIAEATTQTIEETRNPDAQNENEDPNMDAERVNPTLLDQGEESAQSCREVGVSADLGNDSVVVAEQGVQCDSIDMPNEKERFTALPSRVANDSPSDSGDKKPEVKAVPVVVPYPEHSSSNNSLRHFNPAAIALNFGGDAPAELSYLAGKGRQFLDIVDLDESDLL